MITPEMYRNALDEIDRLKHELRQCKEIGNNLIEEVTALRSALRIVPGKVTVEDREWARDKIIDELEARERVLREALEEIERGSSNPYVLRVVGTIARAALSTHKEGAP
jgi:hypothetical protein